MELELKRKEELFLKLSYIIKNNIEKIKNSDNLNNNIIDGNGFIFLNNILSKTSYSNKDENDNKDIFDDIINSNKQSKVNSCDSFIENSDYNDNEINDNKKNKNNIDNKIIDD